MAWQAIKPLTKSDGGAARLLPHSLSHLAGRQLPATIEAVYRRRAGDEGVPGRRHTGDAGPGGAPGARLAPPRAGRAGRGVLQGHPPRPRPVGHPRYAAEAVARPLTAAPSGSRPAAQASEQRLPPGTGRMRGGLEAAA